MTDQSLKTDKQGESLLPPFEVQARWDADGSVWWAESNDLPGLVTEAASFNELVGHVKSLAPTVIKENLGRAPGGLTVHVSGDAVEETFRI